MSAATKPAGDGPRSAQRQLPVLTDQVVTEAVVSFLVDQPEAGRLVDPPGRHQDVVRPQDDRVIAGLRRERGARLDQARTDPETARPRLDQEDAQLRGRGVPLAADDAAGAAPSTSAIQAASRPGRKPAWWSATIRATSASKSPSQPNSSA
jgi:hypothetical protein